MQILIVKRHKFILALVMLGGMTAVFLIQYQSIAKLRAENGVLRGQLGQLNQVKVESDSVGDASATTDALNESQNAELLTLRGELTHLRGQASAIASLRQENEQLISTLKMKRIASGKPLDRPKKTPQDALPQDIHPKESWGYRGYDSPEATIESMLSAAENGDKAGFLRAFPPEIQREFMKDFEGKDFTQEFKKEAIQEFRVLDRQVVSDDERVLSVYTGGAANENTNGKEKTEDIHFKKINGQWIISNGD
jgi:hypothetical protein